jgi:hypothetical protein
MFYVEPHSDFLRMGDVVSGYISLFPDMDEPIKNKVIGYRVIAELPELLVIITPCCSIGDKQVSVVPLEQMRRRLTLFEVEYLKDDMTKVNRKMEPYKALTPSKWDEKTPEEKLAIINRQIDYQYDELFVYAGDGKLPKYTVNLSRDTSFESDYHFIDFRKATRVKCNCIISPDDKNNFTSEKKDKSLSTKLLELHPKIRQELRCKISNYYHRIPKEDESYISQQESCIDAQL